MKNEFFVDLTKIIQKLGLSVGADFLKIYFERITCLLFCAVVDRSEYRTENEIYSFAGFLLIKLNIETYRTGKISYLQLMRFQHVRKYYVD